LDVTLKAFFLAISGARIASPGRVASQGEATALVLPLEAKLTLLCKAFPSSEVRIGLLLALNGTLFLASRQIFLTLDAVSGSDAAPLLACKGALMLALRAAGIVIPSSVVDASEAAVASLLAQSALALASHDRRG